MKTPFTRQVKMQNAKTGKELEIDVEVYTIESEDEIDYLGLDREKAGEYHMLVPHVMTCESLDYHFGIGIYDSKSHTFVMQLSQLQWAGMMVHIAKLRGMPDDYLTAFHKGFRSMNNMVSHAVN